MDTVLTAPAVAEPAPGPAPTPADTEPAPWRRGLRRARRHRGLVLGALVLALVLLAALAAPWLSPHDPYAQDITQRLQPPVWQARGSWAHPLGTDKLGRDMASRLLHGARVSLQIGAAVVLMAGLIGTTLGLLAGYFGGKVDAVVSYLITTRLAMPVVLVALALAALVGGSLQVVILLLGSLLWDRFAIVTRAAAQQLRDAEFIAAAQALGAGHGHILLRELLPNLASALTVVATLEMAHAILLEATLSFLGLGVPPPTPSWGLMVAEGKAYMFFQPWVIVVPGAVLGLLVLAINLVGDGLRDISAPEGRH